MGNAVPRRPHNAKRADNGARDAVKQVDGPAEGVKKPCEWPSDHQGDAFGTGQADGFGNQFAEDNVYGALVPKTISLARAERIALMVARPFAWFLNSFR